LLLPLSVDAATIITATVTTASPFDDNGTDSSVGTSTAVRNYAHATNPSNDPDHLLQDTFVYDPLTPLSASPATSFSDATHYHGAGVTSVISFDVPFTMPAADPTQTIFVVDIWPRTAGGGGWHGRDNSFTIEVLDSSGGSLATLASGIADNTSVAAGFSRNEFSLPVGTSIDSVTITTPAGNVAYSEVRFAAIPEPSHALLLAMAACGHVLRRRRA
jgi:hypothetical protein